MIKGYFDEDGVPRLNCMLSIPELNIENQPLTLTISTGTALSTMHPLDAHKMGINPAATPSHGFPTPTVKAALTFQDEETPVTVHLDRFRIIHPVNRYLKPASILGMDVIRKWTMVYNPRKNSLTFQPATLEATSNE